MGQSWAERNEAWEGRARSLGERAVLHVGHKTKEQQESIFKKQRVALIPRFMQALELVYPPPQKILDFGCGVGRWTFLLSRLGNFEVLGVDPTQTFLDHCTQHREWPNNEEPFVDFARLEDGRIPAGDETFDAVWCCMVLSTILDESGGMYDATLRELSRVLRKGGLFFLVDNTAGPKHRPVVRSPYSISRTVEQYTDSVWHVMNVRLERVGEYEDLGEINTIFAGVKR